jgi:cytochrome b
MTTSSEVKVWDPLIRLLHWATVTLCLLNFFVLEEGSKPHRYVGYTLALLLLVRVVWGFAGTYYARFGQWWPTPGKVQSYLQQLLKGRHPYYLGHNPMGALMIWLLILLLVSPSPPAGSPPGMPSGAKIGWKSCTAPSPTPCWQPSASTPP